MWYLYAKTPVVFSFFSLDTLAAAVSVRWARARATLYKRAAAVQRASKRTTLNMLRGINKLAAIEPEFKPKLKLNPTKLN